MEDILLTTTQRVVKTAQYITRTKLLAWELYTQIVVEKDSVMLAFSITIMKKKSGTRE